MYNVIVVGTDGSDTASAALDHAAHLASLTGATLHIVHAYRPLTTGQIATAATAGLAVADFEQVNKGLVAHSEEICAQAAAQARKQGVQVEIHAVPHDAADALVTVAENVGADLVVVGNRGMSGAKRFVLGSVPNKVSHHCPCSLLIVDTRGD